VWVNKVASYLARESNDGLPTATDVPPAAISNMRKERRDLRYFLISTCVSTIGKIVFPTLELMMKWATLELSQDHDGVSLIFVDAVTLVHSIGTKFATMAEICNQIYKNNKSGLTTLSLMLNSILLMLLPQVFGDRFLVEGMLLPCAHIHSDWYSSNNGIMSGVKNWNVYQGGIE
jgi:hypothetical protein